MRRATSAAVLVAILTVGIAGGFGLQRAIGARPGAPQEPPKALPAATELQTSFENAADFAMRSVVHLTTQTQPAPEDFWTLPAQSVGSGVVVSPEGHILTNHHVIRGSKVRIVRFVDGREFNAELVGEDPESDLALLKIDTKGEKLQPLPFADSDKVKVGDWVLAVGSPFNYTHSVTAGIVSAKHRRTETGQVYRDFLQTDAAINPGNSGGALVNLNGQLVGINAAIVSQVRGFEGIGLAISSNLAAWVTDRLMKEGRVRRGYLGVAVADVGEKLVEALGEEGIKTVQDLLGELGLDSPRGAVIANLENVNPRVNCVIFDSPAAKAGLRFMDVIVEIDGRRVLDTQELFFRIAEYEPGRKVKIKFVRDRKTREVELELAERKATRR